MRMAAPKRSQRSRGDSLSEADPPSVLGRHLTVRGRLDSTGEVQVHGVVAGDINARKVTLWQDGYVEGNVLAEEAHIYGQLSGRATARTVVIGVTAIIEGQIFHHTIDMAKGAQVNARLPWRPVNYFEQIALQLQQIQ